jgi:hypothetical protein
MNSKGIVGSPISRVITGDRGSYRDLRSYGESWDLFNH